nr:3-hydroxybutyryl-CoA dehydrogenase [Tanacetum cinerariifolium]
ESASFIQAFSKIGLVPDSGGTYFLPRLVGMQRASALMMLGDKVSAADAVQMGMIYKSFPDEAFDQEVAALARKLAAMPTKGLAYTKHLLNSTFGNDVAQQLRAEGDYQLRAGHTADYREGVAAFMEKRQPTFTGHGAMGAGIAQVVATAGHPVRLLDQNAAALEKATSSIAASLRRLAEKGKLTTEAAEAALARLHPTETMADFADCGLVIEAIVEDLGVKQQVFRGVEAIVSAECWLASNTSSLSITAIAAA